MDLPKCKICGDRHRLGACSPTSSDGGVENRATPDNAMRQERVAGITPDRGTRAATVQRQVSPTGPSEAKFDRVAYQREYMVGWRARQKAKKDK